MSRNFCGLASLLSIQILTVFASAPAFSLPNMSVPEVLSWSRRISGITTLQKRRKLEEGYSDYQANVTLIQGRVKFDVYLFEKSSLVESESVDYRPPCNTGEPNCRGYVRFEQADKAQGRRLIGAIWGEEILNDFLNSKLMHTNSGSGTYRWYQGTKYNYETFHYGNYTIAQFSVVSKNSPQAKRISEYLYCLTNYC